MSALSKVLSDAVDGLIVDDAKAELAALEAWKDAVEEACVIDWVQVTTPEETLSRLIEWNIVMALDPKISKDAKDLIAPYEAVAELLQEAVDTHFLEMSFAIRCRKALDALKVTNDN
jgi:hypothetical protein